jgi:hypothetical protein
VQASTNSSKLTWLAFICLVALLLDPAAVLLITYTAPVNGCYERNIAGKDGGEASMIRVDAARIERHITGSAAIKPSWSPPRPPPWRTPVPRVVVVAARYMTDWCGKYRWPAIWWIPSRQEFSYSPVHLSPDVIVDVDSQLSKGFVEIPSRDRPNLR